MAVADITVGDFSITRGARGSRCLGRAGGRTASSEWVPSREQCPKDTHEYKEQRDGRGIKMARPHEDWTWVAPSHSCYCSLLSHSFLNHRVFLPRVLDSGEEYEISDTPVLLRFVRTSPRPSPRRYALSRGGTCFRRPLSQHCEFIASRSPDGLEKMMGHFLRTHVKKEDS